MKLFLVPVLVVAAALSAEAPSVSGKWKVQRSAAGRESTQDCTFEQKGEQLTGSCASDRGTVQIRGKVAGKKVTWTYKTDSEGGPVTVESTGNFDGASKITGTMLAVEFAVEGEFVATLVK